jgi:hypothetical protein
VTDAEFHTQIERLGAQFGAKAYTGERLKFILLEVRKERGDIFERAVTRLIKTKRAAPLVLDISQAIGDVHAEDKQRARESAPAFSGFDGLLKTAASKTRADKDYVRACIRTLQEYTTGKIDKAQFISACNDLDRVADQINPRGRVSVNVRKEW